MYTSCDIFNGARELRDIFDRYFDVSAPRRAFDFPYTNVYEKEDSVKVTVLVPGIQTSDINLELIDQNLVLNVKRAVDTGEKETAIRSERSFGEFSKAIKLPYRVDSEKIQAEVKDGILTVTLLKSEEAKPKKIAIQ